MRIEGLAWAGSASKAGLARMAEDSPFAATRQPQPVLYFREKRDLRKRARASGLILAGLICLALAAALLAARAAYQQTLEEGELEIFAGGENAIETDH